MTIKNRGVIDMMISEQTKTLLNRLVQMGFIANRLWDRGLSVLDIKFSMAKFEKTFHEGLAHKFPVDWSDNISDILKKWNELTDYLETPTDNTIYDSPLQFFEENLRLHQEMYQLLIQTMDNASQNKDYNVVADLEKFMTMFNSYMAQAILLVDKAEQYGDNYKAFDRHCKDFLIIGGED